MKILVYVLVLLTSCNALQDTGVKLKNFCYYTNWKTQSSDPDIRFDVEHINPSLCTHLLYAFANINEKELKLYWSQQGDDNGKLGSEAAGRYYEFTELKKRNAGLVTLLSIGGQTAESAGFIQIVQSEENMRQFAKNCIRFLRDRKFDGLDIDWEYPDNFKNKYTQFLEVMQNEFKAESTSEKDKLLLTIAVSGGEEHINKSYNISEIDKHVDYILVMAYDFFGTWSTVAGFTAPLYSRKTNLNFNQAYSQDWAIRRWIDGGAQADKLVLGLTGTALSYTLINSSRHDVGSPVSSTIGANKQLTYYGLCKTVSEKWTKVWDEEQKMVYAYADDQWIGYANATSMQEAVHYAYSQRLAGVMFWSLDIDDFNGAACNEGKYPLVSAIMKAIQKESSIGNENPSVLQTQTVSSFTTKKDNRTRLYFVRNGAENCYSSAVLLAWMCLCILVIANIV
ncbi:hypothetical protein CHS0354_040866 [Potamilus streckersoni]|uniref:GH18 domain-containing protein n=1 Tax=Potamilus streckersoni TaxID=2493646 RepID=A0AAE0SLG3_9BIVA|nr:hypothetical protein CHS0354_040866 [Potamilus streckersoni]